MLSSQIIHDNKPGEDEEYLLEEQPDLVPQENQERGEGVPEEKIALQRDDVDAQSIQYSKEKNIISKFEESLCCELTGKIFYNPVSLLPKGYTVEEDKAKWLIENKQGYPVHDMIVSGYVCNWLVKQQVDKYLNDNPEARIRQYIPAPPEQQEEQDEQENLNAAPEGHDPNIDLFADLIRALHSDSYTQIQTIISSIKNNRNGLNSINSVIPAGDYKGVPPIYWLAGNPVGREILRTDQALRAKITAEGLNSIKQSGDDKGTSAVYWLAGTPDGREILRTDQALRNKITAIGLNSIKQSGDDKGVSALFWLAGYPGGREIICTDQALRDKITADGLNSIRQTEEFKGTSALYWLAGTPNGQEILRTDPDLRAKITAIGLNSIIQTEYNYNKGTSALYSLAGNPVGREILLTDQALRNKITAIGLNSIKQTGNDKSTSAASILLSCEGGIELFLQNPNLLAQITAEGLKALIAFQNPRMSITEWLLNTDNGKRLLATNLELQAKIILPKIKQRILNIQQGLGFFKSSASLKPMQLQLNEIEHAEKNKKTYAEALARIKEIGKTAALDKNICGDETQQKYYEIFNDELQINHNFRK